MALGQVALARRMGDAAERVRSVQRQVATVDTGEWSGLAAARFRIRLGEVAQQVAGVAEGCDRAADRLSEHARALKLVAP